MWRLKTELQPVVLETIEPKNVLRWNPEMKKTKVAPPLSVVDGNDDAPSNFLDLK